MYIIWIRNIIRKRDISWYETQYWIYVCRLKNMISNPLWSNDFQLISTYLVLAASPEKGGRPIPVSAREIWWFLDIGIKNEGLPDRVGFSNYQFDIFL